MLKNEIDATDEMLLVTWGIGVGGRGHGGVQIIIMLPVMFITLDRD